MERPSNFPTSSHRLPLAAFVIGIAAMYFAKDVLVPFALAVLFAFLLTPSVSRLESLRLGRMPSVAVVMIVALSLVGGIGWIVGNQLIDIVNELPNYTNNIRTKLDSFHGSHSGGLAKATDNVQKLSKELSAPPEIPVAPPATQRSRTQRSAMPSSDRPVRVELTEPIPSPLQSLRALVRPLVAPISMAVIVIVFTAVMLIKREDLRNRLLRLAGQGRLNLATQAFDDAAQRVSHYLRLQFVVNTTFGLLMAIGLYFIGIPSALLWGVLAGILRFVPYIGPIIGGSLPLILALAVFQTWLQLILCLCLFLVIELTVAYVIEPWLYGTRIGISSLAILVAAAFWTALWGPIGLVLSTPLTVCLVVLGRYVPQLEFLHIILGDEPVLSSEAQFYQRLLAMDQREARSVVDTFLKDRSLVELYDGVMIPALSFAEEERHKGALDETRENFLIHSINEFIADLAEHGLASTVTVEAAEEAPLIEFQKPVESRADLKIMCIPASDRADESTAAMLTQILELAGYTAALLPIPRSPGDALDLLSRQECDVVCISALPPFALLHVRSLTKQLRRSFPNLRIVVGLWNFSGGGPQAEERLETAFSVEVVTTLAQAMERIQTPTESRPVESMELAERRLN
jgi:predicted PurR-regulated permease PerM